MKKISWITILALSARMAQAATVNFDLSGSYDYDAYITGEEIAANGANVATNLGDHRIYLGQSSGWGHLVDPAKLSGTSYAGITNTSINSGQFQLAAGLTGNKFGTATGTTKVNNSIARLNNQLANQTNRTATVMLAAGQQGKYTNFNVLVNGQRYNTRSSDVFMGAKIEVKYVGDANWYTIWSESVNINTNLTAGVPVRGGVFGGGYTGSTYSFQSADWDAVIVNDLTANGIYKTSAPASGTDTMFKLAAPATLDSNKVLEGFRLTATTTDAARYNDFILYAASATAASSTSCNLVFDNTTPAQFVQQPAVTTNLSFAVLNNGTDASNVTVSLAANGSYSWLTVDPATNSIPLINTGALATNFFNVTIASNAPGGVYSDALTLTMQGTGTDAVTKDFSTQISLQVLNTVSASISKTVFVAADTNGADTATLTVSNGAPWELSFILTNAPAAAWLSYPSGTLTIAANTSTGITITANGSLSAGQGIYSNVLSATWLNNASSPNPTNFPLQFTVNGAAPVVNFMVDLSGNWNTSASGNMNYTRPPVTTNGTAVFYDNDFSTAILTNGQAGSGGSYQGQNVYAAFRQQNDAGAPADITTLRSGSADYLEFGANALPAGAGEFDFMYVFKKADFYKGLNTGNVGFDTNSSFSISASIWTADAKVLRAVVQNGSTWYISQESNTVAQAGTKVITTNAYDALWAVWDPTTDISAASLSFASTVAGSTFTDIQAVGIWGAFADGAVNPSARIETIQIGGVAASGSSSNFLLTASVTGGNGFVSPASTNVASGGSAEFTITADSYYRIASLTTNGAAVTGMSFDNNSTTTNFTWSNVQAAGVLVATFTAQLANDPAGTPHAWLAQYGLTNFDADAYADLDGDGLKAWQEYIAGTDPTNSVSTLRVVESPRNVLSWSAVSGRVYSVYWTTNLLSGFQALETNIPAPQASYTNVTAVPSAIYQLKVQMP